MPRSLNCFENLLDLNLAGNIICEVPTEIGKLRSLKKLDVSYQGKGDLLESLPEELRALELLEELRLSGNNFSYLPDCMFPVIDGSIIKEPGMTNLRVLAIDRNPLLGLDENLAVCGKLQKLLVHSTKIRRLNKSITFMYFLEEIWIANTNIRKLDSAITTMPYLRKLVLAHEDQLDDFMDIRRMMRADKWSFLNPGEGEVAQFVAEQKYEEARRRTMRVQEANSDWNEREGQADAVCGGGGGMDRTYGSVDLMDDTITHSLDASSRLLNSTHKTVSFPL